MEIIEKIKNWIAFGIVGLAGIIVVAIISFAIYIGTISVYNVIYLTLHGEITEFYKDMFAVIVFFSICASSIFLIYWSLKRVEEYLYDKRIKKEYNRPPPESVKKDNQHAK